MSDAESDEAVLRRSFAVARAHDWYRERLGGIADHRDAPATDKAMLLDRLDGFAPGADGRGVYLVRSGGSTRAPLIFPVDIAENHAQRAALAERLGAAGIFDPRTIALNIFGYADLYRTAAIVDDLLERCAATALPMSAHARYEDMAAIARRFRPSHILGTPSKLALFARFLAEAGERLDIPHLLYAGEPLRESMRALLTAHFGVAQIWSLYGGAETGIWAWSDASRRPGLFSLLPGIVVEVQEPDAEGFGALAVTNGFRLRYPVFRYRVGDIGRLIEQDGERLLDLRGRDRRSFQFAELTYDLDLFAPLAGGAESFQIQLRYDAAGRDRLDLLLVDEEGAGEPEAVAVELARILGCAAPDDLFEVRRVGREALHQDPVTTKTPPIVDFRR